MKFSIVKNLRSIWGSIQYHYFRRLYENDPQSAADELFKRVYGRPMDMITPKHLIEKITWLQFNTDTSLWTLCADKFRMREYVNHCGLSSYLPILYGHWDNLDSFNISTLPNEFVLKANNGCGTVIIVKDKTKIEVNALIKTMKSWLSRPYGYHGAQTHYLRIKPCILAEEVLSNTGVQKTLSPLSLIDYKIWCFNGEPECCLITYNRTAKGIYIDMYDLQWNRIDNFLQGTSHCHLNKDILIPKPICWEEMLKIAKTLAQPFQEVRVDLYVVNDKPYIGELTFTSGYGYFTEDYYNFLGNKIELPITMKSNNNI